MGIPAFIARCRSRSASCPVLRSCPIDRIGVPFDAYSVINHPVSGWLISSEPPLYDNVPTPFRASEPRTTRAAPWQEESAGPAAGGVEDRHTLAAIRGIRHGEGAVVRHVERAWLDELP